jgi:glycerol-3-phosphate dehydrogenase (NAD(P)+)
MAAPADPVLVVGATSWGCTLAIQLDRAGSTVAVLCRSSEEAAELARSREQRRLLPGIALPESIDFVIEPPANPNAVILAVPAQTLRANLRALLPHLHGDAPIVSAAKGIELDTHLRMSEVITDELRAAGRDAPVVALSGPNLAREVAVGQAATTVVASTDGASVERLRELLMSPSFRVYTNDDIVGVELGGALKNIVAIGVGIGDALNIGDNGRAAFLTRGLAEMARLGLAVGARPLTFMGLACLGDLIATAASPSSRNRTLGEQLGRGEMLQDILAATVHVTEGVETTRAVRELAREHQIELPIVEAMHDVLFDALPPNVAIQRLMTREAQSESAALGQFLPAAEPN